MIKEIAFLIQKDIMLELKQRYAINGILLYIISTIFVSYLSFSGVIDNNTWNSLFWIIMLFASVNAVSKSFIQENNSRQIYYYTLTSPQTIILAKIVYNFILMSLLSLLTFLFYSILMGDLITNYTLFIITLFLGSLGFSSSLTLISAIASRTNNNFTLMAVLSFPIVMPLLLILMKVSKAALNMESIVGNIQYLAALLLLNIVIISLSYILFPYLWRD